MTIASRDYFIGTEWVRKLEHSDSKVRQAAANRQPSSFSGNSDSFYSCRSLADDRILLSSNSAPCIRPILNLQNIYNERVSLPSDTRYSRFIRDSSVTVFPRGLLIPYSIRDPLLFNRLLAWLPSSSDCFIVNKKSNGRLTSKSIYGKGFTVDNTTFKKRLCYQLHIPFKQAKTCIEGGNCFLFLSKGQQKAIVGNHSLFLSLIALEEQGSFDHLDTTDILNPSLDSIRIARNLELYRTKLIQDYARYLKSQKHKKIERLVEPEQRSAEPVFLAESDLLPKTKKFLNAEEEAYRRALICDVTEEDKIFYWEQAKLIEAKLIATKQAIAEDLGIDLGNIAFVPQTQFHIDMELTVTPNGKVMTHDSRLVEGFLAPLLERVADKAEMVTSLEQYAVKAAKHSKKYDSIYERRVEILEEHEIDVTRMPALFRSSGMDSSLNYCNGIFMNKGHPVVAQFEDESSPRFGKIILPGSVFVTTGPSNPLESLIHQQFVTLFENVYKEDDYSCKGIEGMSTFLKKHKGGVHCLSLNISPVLLNF